MANTILKQINDIGGKLGYPFYVYSNGTCGTSIASGDLSVVIEVKKKFPVKVLRSEFLNCSLGDDNCDILLYLSKIGENLGFPFYVYYNGTCGVTPCMMSGNFPFIMAVHEKIGVKQIVGTSVLHKKVVMVDDKISTNEPVLLENNTKHSLSSKTNLKPLKDIKEVGEICETKTIEKKSKQVTRMPPFKTGDSVALLLEKLRKCSLMTDFSDEVGPKKNSDELLSPQVLKSLEWAVVRFGSVDDLKKYCAISDLSDEGREYLISRENPYLLKAYVCAFELKGKALSWLLRRCNEDVIMAYLDAHPIRDNNAQILLVNNASDSLLKEFVQKYELFSDAQCLMISRRSEDIVLAYVEKHELSDLAQIFMLQKCNADTVGAYILKYEFFFLAQVLMVAKLGDNMTMAYIEKYQLCSDAQIEMIQKCSEDVVQAYRKRYGLAISSWWNMGRKYGWFWFVKPC